MDGKQRHAFVLKEMTSDRIPMKSDAGMMGRVEGNLKMPGVRDVDCLAGSYCRIGRWIEGRFRLSDAGRASQCAATQ